MKSLQMRSFSGFGVALALASALVAGDAGAVARPYDFGLTQHWSECGGPGQFNVRLRWTPVPGVTSYPIASGNHCRLRNVVCGTHGGCGEAPCTGPARARSCSASACRVAAAVGCAWRRRAATRTW